MGVRGKLEHIPSKLQSLRSKISRQVLVRNQAGPKQMSNQEYPTKRTMRACTVHEPNEAK